MLSHADRVALLNRAQAELTPDQFVQTLALAAAQPINEQVIEKSVVRSIFPTDQIDTPVTFYTKKKRSGPALIIHKFGEPYTQIKRFERVQVEPYIIAHKFTLNEFDIRDALYNIVDDEIQQSSTELALKEDRELLRVLDAYAPALGANDDTQAPSVVLGPDGLSYELSGNSYRVGDLATAPDGGLAGDVRVSDFIAAQALGAEIGFEFTTALMNPHGYAQLVGQNQFLWADRAGSNTALNTGRIQNLLGFNIITSRLVPRKTIYLMDPSELAVWVERDPVEVRTETHGFFKDWTAFERAAPFVRNANAYIRLTFNN